MDARCESYFIIMQEGRTKMPQMDNLYRIEIWSFRQFKSEHEKDKNKKLGV